MARRLRNVTVTLDEETARWARVEAAERDVSVSRLISDLLRERMIDGDLYEVARKTYLAQEPRVHRAPGTRYPSRDELHERDRLR
jgi:hypothetical protein